MPDFGIFRGFGSKLFSDKLYAGQLPTQLGLIGSENFGFDVDSLAFFNRVTTAGGTLSANEQIAIDNLVKQMKLDGIWSKMIAIYPFVGASAAACSQNLISSSFTGSFSSGWTFSSQGVQGNGTSAFFDTNLEWSSNTSIYDVSVGAYLNTFDFNSSYYGIGNGGYYVTMRMGNDHYINNNANTAVSGTMATGLHILSRSNSSTQEFFINEVNSSASDTLDPKQKPVGDFYFGAGNGSNLAGNFNSSRHALGFVSSYLDSNNRINFYTAVQAFQTTLSRQV